MNEFINNANKQSAKGLTQNGAKTFKSYHNAFVTDFSNATRYITPREYSDVDLTMSKLWSINPETCLKLAMLFRLITRTVKYDNSVTDTTQRGTGLKHEGAMRMYWIGVNHPKIFWDNIALFIAMGSWYDLFQMLRWDLRNGWENRRLDWTKVIVLIKAGLESDSKDLLLKFMPSIKSKKNSKGFERSERVKQNTIIGKYIASKLCNSSYEMYRKLKSSGKGHEWQQYISRQEYDSINLKRVPGKALSMILKSSFIEKSNALQEQLLERLTQGLNSTEYAHDLYLLMKELETRGTFIASKTPEIINSKMKTIIDKAKLGMNANTRLMPVIDTSGSMDSGDSKIPPIVYAKGLTVFLSHLFEGHFGKTFFEFNDGATFHDHRGLSPYQSFKRMQDICAYESTNFMSVIKELCKIRKTVDESEFPTGIVCLSDQEYNRPGPNKTNYKAAVKLLKEHFSPEFVKNFQFILWDLNSTNANFQTYEDCENLFYLSGFDGSLIAFITGIESTDKEGNKTIVKAESTDDTLEIALSQSIFDYVKI